MTTAIPSGAGDTRAEADPKFEPSTLGRRSFLGAAGKLAATAAAAGSLEVAFEKDAQAAPANLDERPGFQDSALVRDNLNLRVERAYQDYSVGVPAHPNNGDEARYPNKIGTDTRGLPHNQYDEVDLAAWATLTRALESQRESDFENVTLGGTRKLVQPLGTLAVNLTGLATPQFAIPPAPALASAERAAEAVEAYWQSLLRDVPFWAYSNDTTNELVLAAANEISQLSGYTGPRDATGQVTPELLFRGTARYRDPTDRKGRRARSVLPLGVALYLSVRFVGHSLRHSIDLWIVARSGCRSRQ